jgi:hypothetical protein
MFEIAPIEITEAEAKHLMEMHSLQPRRKVTLHHAGKWYDVRHMSIAEVVEFMISVRH